MPRSGVMPELKCRWALSVEPKRWMKATAPRCAAGPEPGLCARRHDSTARRNRRRAAVDCVVLTEPEHHMQTYGTQFNPAFSGELRLPPPRARAAELSDRKVIARRAVLELAPNSVINVGVGSIPDQVPLVAGEERVQDLLSLAVDSGVIGGVPMSGLDFGAAINYQAVIDHACASSAGSRPRRTNTREPSATAPRRAAGPEPGLCARRHCSTARRNRRRAAPWRSASRCRK